jgi:predicted membrane-bound mannosyltransferase
MAVSDEPKKPASAATPSVDAIAWLKANWPRYWEVGVLALIVLVAAGLRLWDLGARSLNHDESLHATYSWYLYLGRGYTHDPMMHGPFQFHFIALIWKGLAFLSTAPFLSNWAHWGPSDYAARLPAALVGTSLVALPFLFRSYIGRLGAIFAALFIAFSPAILYFSRFARNDIYIAFFTLATVICMWRYLSERRTLYLYLIAALLALSFATKEVEFMTVAIFLLFLDMLFAWEILGQLRERYEAGTAASDDPAVAKAARRVRKKTPPPAPTRQPTVVQWALTFVCLVPVAWLVAITWPLTERWRARWSLQWPLSGDLMIVMGTLAGTQFAAAVQMLPFIGDKGYFQDPGVNEDTLMKMSVFIFLAVAAYVGLLWRPRIWLIAAGIFFAIFVLLFTTFFTNMGGFWTGIWGSFDYWLQQQDVQRGDQPVYYYLMILPMYEFLPLVFAAVGAAWFLLRRQFLLSLAAVLGVCAIIFLYFTVSTSLLGMVPVLVVLGLVLFALRQDLFTTFLIFWAVGSLIAFATAGEKMPWLTIHMAIPLIILAASRCRSAGVARRPSSCWRPPPALSR